MGYLDTMYDRDRLEQLVRSRYHAVSLSLTGAVNTRDMGGLPAAGGKKVRRMVLFRSGELSGITPQDALILSRTCNVRLTVDLRSGTETLHRPDKVIPGSVYRAFTFAENDFYAHTLSPSELFSLAENEPDKAVRFLEKSSTADLKSVYSRLCIDTETVSSFGKLLCTLYDLKSGSTLIHSTWGKDRAGAAAALILLLLGVSEENVLLDYCTSNAVCYELQDRLNCPDISAETIQRTCGVDDSLLCLLLDSIRKNHGSPEGFAKSAAGFDDAAIEELRQRYLI